jgi:group I intron endonuclease
MGVIYKITSPSGKLYVGKTYNLKQRIACHKCSTKKGSSVILHNSIRKYGWDAHKLEVIEEVPDEQLDEREMFWIAELKTYCYKNPMGLNMTLGGDGQRSTWMHKTERREWYRNRYSGVGNPFYGKTHSEEVRKFISKSSSNWNKLHGVRVPDWGAEKGWQKVRRPVVCYDTEGNFVGEYISIVETAKKLGIPKGAVVSSLLYESWAQGLYMFRYKTDSYPMKIDAGPVTIKNVKRPVLYFIDNLMFEYPSSLEASIELGVPKTTINRAACYNNMRPIRSGHVFIYKDLFEKFITNQRSEMEPH